jgi:cytosine/adenosine deaminase-related metal-dependent hydrolase
MSNITASEHRGQEKMANFSTSYLFDDKDQIAENVSVITRGEKIVEIKQEISHSRRRSLTIPALINAHDHARPRLSSFGAIGMPLETWILRSAFATPPDPYLVAASALGRSAKAGCGGMMIHYTRSSGNMGMIDEARAIARAAEDVGIRLGFALALRDRNPLVYGDNEAVLARLPLDVADVVRKTFVKPAVPPKQLVELTEEVATAIQGPMVNVQFGPAGVQWCSRALLEAVAEASALSGRRVHMHLLETPYQRRWADQEFPEGMMRYLRDIGLLSPRLTVAHCVHATPAELDILGESGARIVTNFSSNLHLGSGIAPIAQARHCGCPICVGVDGLALDEDDDILREMRLVQLVHRGEGFKRNWTSEEFLRMVIRNGREAIGAPGDGGIKPGAAADFILLDYGELDDDALVPMSPIGLLFSRGNRTFVRDVIVAGRLVVSEARLTGIDLSEIEIELRQLYKANIGRSGCLTRAWPSIESEVERWFTDFLGCSFES